MEPHRGFKLDLKYFVYFFSQIIHFDYILINLDIIEIIEMLSLAVLAPNSATCC